MNDERELLKFNIRLTFLIICLILCLLSFQPFDFQVLPGQAVESNYSLSPIKEQVFDDLNLDEPMSRVHGWNEITLKPSYPKRDVYTPPMPKFEDYVWGENDIFMRHKTDDEMLTPAEKAIQRQADRLAAAEAKWRLQYPGWLQKKEFEISLRRIPKHKRLNRIVWYYELLYLGRVYIYVFILRKMYGIDHPAIQQKLSHIRGPSFNQMFWTYILFYIISWFIC